MELLCEFGKKALRDPTYTLKDILADGRREEQSSFQARKCPNFKARSCTGNKTWTTMPLLW